jgi:hypothetical protein
MPWTLRVAAFLAGVCALYVLGYIVMTVTPPPLWPVWMVPLALAAGAAWYLLERLDARLSRRARERSERGTDGHA